MRQIGASHKTTGGRARKIGECNRVSPGVGLINESKRKRVRDSHKRICATGPHVPRIFMQGSAGQKARCPLGSDHGDGVSVERPVRSTPVPHSIREARMTTKASSGGELLRK